MERGRALFCHVLFLTAIRKCLFIKPRQGRGYRGPEYEKSWTESVIDSEMAGPISMKLSEIDQGDNVTVLGQKN